MFQSYHRLAPPSPDATSTDRAPRPTVDALFADWLAMGRIARQALDQAERAQLAYTTVLDAYRDARHLAGYWREIAVWGGDLLRDQDARVAELESQNTELLGQCDKAQAKILQLELSARRRTTYTVDAERDVQPWERLYGTAHS